MFETEFINSKIFRIPFDVLMTSIDSVPFSNIKIFAYLIESFPTRKPYKCAAILAQMFQLPIYKATLASVS